MNQHQIGTTCVWIFYTNYILCFFFISFYIAKIDLLSLQFHAYTHSQATIATTNNTKKDIFFFIHFNLIRTNFKLKVRFIWPYNTCFVVFVYFVFFRLLLFMSFNFALCIRHFLSMLMWIKKIQQIWEGIKKLLVNFGFFFQLEEMCLLVSDFFKPVKIAHKYNSTLMSNTTSWNERQIIFFLVQWKTHSVREIIIL